MLGIFSGPLFASAAAAQRTLLGRIAPLSPLLTAVRGVKTHSGAKKRWTDNLQRGHTGHRHNLSKKSSSRLSALRDTATAHKTHRRALRRLLPGVA